MMKNSDEEYCQRSRQSIHAEYDHLHNRLVILTLLDVLFQTNPPFFDESRDEIAEPWQTIFDCYADVINEEQFIKRLQEIQKKKDRPKRHRQRRKGG
jgi:hypothetical protein